MTGSSGSSGDELVLKHGFYTLNADGGIEAEQGQPSGEASIGAVLKDPDGALVDDISEVIGFVEDHHVAEYRALIVGLRRAQRHGIERLRVFLDSALVVNTVNGDWQVDPDHLKQLSVEARALVGEFLDIKLCWVPREMNTEADSLAGRALRGR